MKKRNRKKDNAAVKRVLVTPDKHFPLGDMPAIRAVCRAIEIVKPDVYVDLGDTFEGESVLSGSYLKLGSFISIMVIFTVASIMQ
jgi:hypothetical protein